jgi:hypothetical protein
MNEYSHFFPVAPGVIVAVKANRDGTPIEFYKGIPIFARYYLTDEFETPLLDPSIEYFTNPQEAIFVGNVYRELVKANATMPYRMFHGSYVAYLRASKELPEVAAKMYSALRQGDIGQSELVKLMAPVIRELLKVVDM